MSRVRDIADNSAVFADGISTADITEGSNLFFTNSRADARITLKMIDEDNMSSDSAAHMPSQQSVKAYIDAQTLVLIDEDNMATNSATRPPSQQSVKAFVDTSVAGLVDSAPGTLDTLNELASALGDDASFSTTVTNSIATKLPLAGGTLTGSLVISGINDLTVGNVGYWGTPTYGKLTWSATNNRAIVRGESGKNLSLGANGTQDYVFIKTDGNVGIGTDNPSHQLHVRSSGNGKVRFEGNTNSDLSDLLISHSTSGDSGLQFNSNQLNMFTYGAITFNAGTGNISGNYPANERMRIDASGNVGIGQINPSYKLEVSGTGDTVQYIANANPSGTQGRTLLIRDNYASSSQDSKISFSATSSPGQDVYLGKRTTSNAGYFHLTNSSGTEHMTVNMANGNVGIGTDSPSANLNVKKVSSTAFSASDSSWHSIVVNNENTSASARTAGIAFQLNGYHVNAGTGIAAVKNGTASDYGASLVFITRPQSAVAEERMRINDSGNVGIGTTNILSNLHVKGNDGLILEDDGTTNVFRIQPANIGGAVIYTGTASSHTEKLRITSSGDFGIGTGQPVSLGGNFNNFNLNGIKGGGLSFSRGTNSATQQYNIYSTDDDGLHIYRGGFANQVMTMDSSGNVGIGTTSPTAQLHVKQTGNSGNNYDEGTVKVGGASSTLGFTMNYSSLGSGRANLTGLNNSGGTNNRMSLGFGAIQSYGEPADRVLTVDQGHFVHHTPPGNARFMPMISPQSVTRHGAYPTHPAGDGIGNNQTNSTQLGFAHVYARLWSGGRYLHMKTNIPCTGSNYGMVLVYAKGYRYSPGGTIDSSWGFHNWGGAIYSLDQRNYATTFAVNCYDSSDNYVVLVGDNQTTGGSYTGFRLDFMYSNTNYPAHTETANGESHYLLATAFSSSTSGVY